MLEMQTIDLAGELQYFLDGSVECHEIPYFTYHTMLLYGDRGRIENIIDREPISETELVHRVTNNIRLFRKTRQQTSRELTDYALELLPNLYCEERAGILLLSTLNLRQQLKDSVDYACCSFWDDMVEGGAMLPWKPKAKRKLTPKIERRLKSEARIKAYVNNILEFDSQAKDIQTVLDLCVRYNPDLMKFVGEIQKPIDIANEKVDEYLKAMQKHRAELRLSLLANRIGLEDDIELDEHFDSDEYDRDRLMGVKKPPYHIIKKERKKRRKVLIRSAALAATLLGQPNVAALAKGQPICIPGQSMNLQLQAYNFGIGHGQLNVKLLDTDNTHLANMCVYFKDTPAMDQAAAFALYMASGNEKKILETGNLTTITSKGIDHPLIVERQSKRSALGDVFLDRFEQRIIEHRKYQQIMLPVFRRHVINRLFGLKQFKQFKLHDFMKEDNGTDNHRENFT